MRTILCVIKSWSDWKSRATQILTDPETWTLGGTRLCMFRSETSQGNWIWSVSNKVHATGFSFPEKTWRFVISKFKPLNNLMIRMWRINEFEWSCFIWNSSSAGLFFSGDSGYRCRTQGAEQIWSSHIYQVTTWIKSEDVDGRDNIWKNPNTQQTNRQQRVEIKKNNKKGRLVADFYIWNYLITRVSRS